MKPSALLPRQEHRLFRLTSPLPEAGLLLDRFSGTESVSAPFRFTLQLLSERADLALKDFLGQPMGVALATAGGGARSFHGHITSFRHTGTDGGLARYQATLGPWTDFLQHRVNCRLFQGRTLPDLLRELFGEYRPQARFEFRIREAAYPVVPLSVQYRESDFQFFSRLLEASGIHYHFRFEPDGHIMVLADDSTLAPAMPGQARISYQRQSGAAREDSIDAWSAARHLVATAHASKTFDFRNPRDPMQAREQTNQPVAGAPAMEHYEPAGQFGFKDFQTGADLVRRRMEEHELRGERVEGGSNCRLLTCGHQFELLGHYRKGATVHDRQYFVTRVHHTGRNNYLSQADPAVYRNSFACVPLLTRYRPPLATPRPVMAGPQTAIVVGPPGEEVHCDAFGRVLIQFHWDREGRFDAASSCFVRVSSPWAGAGFGFVAVPRIGQEVVVEFLDGDPDRPIITGGVYNELCRPPWALPGSATQSGILTRSSKGGASGHANALRFEDRKGEEEVWLQAEKDLRIEVEHDQRRQVGHDESGTVGNDRQLTVGHDCSRSVGHDDVLDVKNMQQISIGLSKSEKVLGASHEAVLGIKNVNVGANYDLLVGGWKAELVGLASTERVEASKTSFIGKVYELTIGDRLKLTVGKSSLTMDADGTILLAGTDITIQGSGHLKTAGRSIDLN